MATRRGELREFLERSISANDAEKCIVWPYRVEPSGYPAITIKGAKRRVNRVVCEAAHGAPPSRLHEAAHSCGNRRCTNPSHLRWTTPAGNTLDKFLHGTVSRGEDIQSAKLTEDDVREIRRRRRDGEPTIKIAENFGIHQSYVYQIISKRYWAWVA